MGRRKKLDTSVFNIQLETPELNFNPGKVSNLIEEMRRTFREMIKKGYEDLEVVMCSRDYRYLTDYLKVEKASSLKFEGKRVIVKNSSCFTGVTFVGGKKDGHVDGFNLVYPLKTKRNGKEI